MKNHRKVFRSPMYDEMCIVSNDYSVSKAYIKDISDTGVGLEVKLDLFNKECEIEFSLKGEEFLRACQIIRKQSKANGRTFYALQFRQSESDRQKIYRKIFQIEAIRNKQRKETKE